MSYTTSSSSNSCSNFQQIISDALKVYQKRTKTDLLLHPLADQIQTCSSPGDILAVLQDQLRGLDQSRSVDDRWTKWLDPTIHVLLTFSGAVGTVGMVCPSTCVYPRSAHSYLFGRHSHPRRSSSPELAFFFQCVSSIIPGVGHCNTYIFQAAKGVRASQDTLVDIFERIESFFRRLEVYTDVPPNTEMMNTIIKIMVEVLSILGIAMKEIKQGWLSE